MKQLALFMLLWQGYLLCAADDEIESPVGLKNAFYTAIANASHMAANNKNKEIAIKSFARLELLANADVEYFNDDQIHFWLILNGEFTAQIKKTFSISDVEPYLREAKKQEISSLITKLKRNQFHDDWADLVGEFDSKPAENILIYQRVEFLKKMKEDYGQETPIQLYDGWSEFTETGDHITVQNIVI